MDGPLSRPLHKGIKVPAPLPPAFLPSRFIFCRWADRGINPLLRYSIVSCPGQARVTGYAIRFARPRQGSASGDKKRHCSPFPVLRPHRFMKPGAHTPVPVLDIFGVMAGERAPKARN
jgi:hypothetical protein